MTAQGEAFADMAQVKAVGMPAKAVDRSSGEIGASSATHSESHDSRPAQWWEAHC